MKQAWEDNLNWLFIFELEVNTMKKEKRFEIIHEEKLGIMRDVFVLRDKQTGAQYLFVQNGYGGGLSPLMNKE